MPHAVNDGVRIHYEVGGAGPPLLLHHGLGMSMRTWEDLGYVEELRRDFLVVTMDARGHGGSDKPHAPEDYGLPAMVGDVTAVLDAEDISRSHYFGYSMGGRLGWGMAELAPDRLRSLLVGAAEPYPSGDSTGSMIDMLEEGMDAVVGAFREMWEMPDRMAEQYLDNDPAALLAYFRSDWPDLSGTTGGIRVPTLLVVGENDPAHDGCERAAEEIDDADFFSLPGLDHLSLLARADLVVPLIRDFVRRVERSSG